MKNAQSYPFQPSLSTTGAIAGITLSLTSVGISQAHQSVQSYEGTVRFAFNPEATVGSEIAGDGVAIAPTAANPLAKPTIDGQPHIHPRQYADFLDLTQQQLQAQGSSSSARNLLRNLQVQIHPQDGILVVHYRGTNADQVYQVLDHLAHAYTADGPDCTMRSCRMLQFIEAQIGAVEQRLQQLEAEADSFQRQHGFQQPAAQQRAIAQSTAALRQQQRQVTQQLAAARRDLQAQSADMGLATDEQVAPRLLSEFLDYRATLEQWQRLDLELVRANLQSPPQTDRLASLQLEHQRLSSHLRHSVVQVAQMPTSLMPTPIFAALEAQPSRHKRLESLLTTAHQVNLLMARQAVLTQMEDRTAAQRQRWQALSKRHARLQKRVTETQATLTAYRSQVNALQSYQQLRTHWQLVAAPELIEPRSTTLAHLLPPNRQRWLSSTMLVLGSTISLGALINLWGARIALPQAVTAVSQCRRRSL